MTFPEGIKLRVASFQEFPVQATCPLCRLEFEFAVEDSESELVQAICPSCGLSFAPIASDPPAASPLSTSSSSSATNELDDWLSSPPTPPPEPKDIERLQQWCRKHKTLVRCGLFCVAAVLIAMIGSFVAAFRTSRLLADAIERRLESESRMQAAQTTAKKLARDALACSEAFTSEKSARRSAEEQIRTGQQNAQRMEEELRKAESRCAQAEGSVRIAIAQHLDSQSQLVSKEHPQHSILLAAEAVSICMQGGEPPVSMAVQRLWDNVGKTCSHTLQGHRGKITSMTVSGNGRWLATASLDNTARLWDLTAAAPATTAVVLVGHLGRVSAVAFSPDNRWLATGSFDSTVRLWNLAAERPGMNPIVLPSRGERIASLAISGNARWLATTSSAYDAGQSTVRLWNMSASDLATGLFELPPQAGRMRAVAFGPNDEWLATAGESDAIRFWDLNAKSPADNSVTLCGREANIRSMMISPDGRWLVAACDAPKQHVVRLWPLPRNGNSSADKPRVCVGHTAPIRALTVSPNSRWLATAGEDKSARVWDLSAEDPAKSVTALLGHEETVQAVTFSVDGRWLITGAGDQTVRLWSIGQKGPQPTPVVLRPGQGPIGVVAVSPDGHWLITAGDDATAQLHNLRLSDWIALALKGKPEEVTATESESTTEGAQLIDPKDDLPEGSPESANAPATPQVKPPLSGGRIKLIP
jgi:WD40 repeat protein